MLFCTSLSFVVIYCTIDYVDILDLVKLQCDYNFTSLSIRLSGECK